MSQNPLVSKYMLYWRPWTGQSWYLGQLIKQSMSRRISKRWFLSLYNFMFIPLACMQSQFNRNKSLGLCKISQGHIYGVQVLAACRSFQWDEIIAERENNLIPFRNIRNMNSYVLYNQTTNMVGSSGVQKIQVRITQFYTFGFSSQYSRLDWNRQPSP